MTQLFESANDNGKDDYGDGVLSFLQFTEERFKDNDPATYAMLQQGMSYTWKQGDVDNAAAQSKDQINQQFAEGLNGTGAWINGGPDGAKMLTMLEAANRQGGTAQVVAMVQSACANPADMMQRLQGDPLRQHMVYDILVAAGYGPQLACVPLSFQP
jgi:hypothetical protein